MIDGNKLRVGNYFVYSNEIMTVGEIFQTEKKDYDLSGIGIHPLHLNGNRYDLDLGRSAGDFEPLPINENYLLGTGFKKITDSVFFLNGFTVVIDGETTHLVNDKRVIDAKGFHELQNEFQDFTGQELPVKLK